MIKINKRSLLYSLLALLLISCASNTPDYLAKATSPGGIGGTGIKNYEGIGGTGKNPEEGIGGTGKVAQVDGGGIGGTGIVGTITAFGSIWVNEAHVHFDQDVPITINQQAASSGELQLGQVVAILSEPLNAESLTTDEWQSDEFNQPAGKSQYQAKSIDIVHEVVGPISQINLADQRIKVMQQTIQLADNTVLFKHEDHSVISLEQLSKNDFIEVSGLRQTNGEIIASRLDIVPESESVQLIGELSQNEAGQWSIGQQSVEIDELFFDQEIDKRLLISGHLEEGIIVADAIGLDSVEFVLDQVTEMIYEGVLFDMEAQDFHEASDLLLELDNFSDDMFEENDYEDFEELGRWESDDYYDDYYEDDEYEDYDDYTEGDYSDENELEYDESEQEEFDEGELSEEEFFDESEIEHDQPEDFEQDIIDEDDTE